MRNEILDLYDERKREQIKNKYKEIVESEFANLEVVQRYNDLVATFETSLAELANEYVSLETPPIVKTGYTSDYSHEINSSLKDQISNSHRDEYNAERIEHDELVREVRAMLSLSNDKDYQIEVLDRYGITKKGKLNI